MTPATVGILGVGHLADHLVPGLLRGEGAPKLLLSPRNAEISTRLARDHGVEVARSNADLVDRATMVLIAVRPFDAAAVVQGLSWRADQTVVSLCAGVLLEDLRPHVAPARLVRAMPLIAARFGHSPTSIYPGDRDVAALFERCGSVTVLDDETQFDIATVMACHSSALLVLVEAMAQWSTAAGLDAGDARALAARAMRAAAETVLGRSETEISGLVDELAAPASATQAGIRHLLDHDACDVWLRANDTVLAHIRAKRD